MFSLKLLILVAKHLLTPAKNTFDKSKDSEPNEISLYLSRPPVQRPLQGSGLETDPAVCCTDDDGRSSRQQDLLLTSWSSCWCYVHITAVKILYWTTGFTVLRSDTPAMSFLVPPTVRILSLSLNTATSGGVASRGQQRERHPDTISDLRQA